MHSDLNEFFNKIGYLVTFYFLTSILEVLCLCYIMESIVFLVTKSEIQNY